LTEPKPEDSTRSKEETHKVLYDNFGISKDGLLGFSDAIFSIAITLLVITLTLPVIQDGKFDEEFIDSLAGLLPRILGFIISFFVIATYWLSLHRIFFFVKRLDKRFIWITLIFLFFIVFMPFPTSVLGQYGNHPLAAIFYAVTLTLSSFIMLSLWQHAAKGRKLVDHDLEVGTIRFLSRRLWAVSLIFLVSIPIALIVPVVAQLIWAFTLIGLGLYKGQK
jgi:TMEM175 potassium channel family protein